jgi:hypothetical protein
VITSLTVRHLIDNVSSSDYGIISPFPLADICWIFLEAILNYFVSLIVEPFNPILTASSLPKMLLFSGRDNMISTDVIVFRHIEAPVLLSKSCQECGPER